MKKTIILLVVLISMSTYAQHEFQNNQRHSKNNFTSEQNATLKSKKMALHLDLNSQQQKEIYGLILKQEKKRDKLRKERQSLKEGKMKITPEKRFKMINKGLNAKLAFQSELRDILSPKQYENWKRDKREHAQLSGERPHPNRQKRRF
ncbi:MAG: hypothetical protein L3J45_06540 [Flavobacteriaceae bacterium]|nr:hypothetical protein [Flavobacteriaceae bacterium]